MIQCPVIIQNKLGLHARASAKFVALSNQFPCAIDVAKGDLRVNGKSIMGMMMLAAAKESEIILIANGEQEAQAIEALKQLIQQRFGEGE